MPFDFFGFTIKRKGVDEEKELISPVTPIDDDGATIVTTSGGFINTAYNLEFGTSDSKLLINKYRELSLQSDIESAIDEIINEAIVTGDGAESPVGIVLDKLPFSEEVKEVISGEFENILNLLDFNANAYEIFKRWYVDGRIYFNIVIDAKNTKDGIQELRYMDPRDINKIKEVKDEYSKRGVRIQKPVKEYYVYNNVNIPADSVASANSGLIDYRNKSVIISYLHKAIKPYNQLRMLEDATVIYRLARAPERRIFKVGTGGLPKIKAEQYVNGLMNKFRNKIVYDSVTGDLRDDAKTLSILEDYWIPVGDDGKSTDISTLPGGCLAMNTEIPLLDGRVLTLAELTDEYKSGKENWTYSCHPTTGEIVPGLISWAGVTQESAKVMKLTFDNGKELICTPDHKFPIFDIGFVEAKDLTVGQSMIPFNSHKNDKIGKLNYEKIYQPVSKKWEFTHRMVNNNIALHDMVWEESYKDLDKNITHHLDHNRFNNNPTNLVKMSFKDHSKYHSDNGFTPEQQLMGTIKAKELLETIKADPILYREYLDMRSSITKTIWENRKDEEYTEVCEKISDGLQKYFSNLSDEEREYRANISKENGLKAIPKIKELYSDKEFRLSQSQKIKEGLKRYKLTEKYKENCKKNSELNRIRMSDPEVKKNIFKNQSIKFSRELFGLFQNIISVNNSISASDLIDQLNENETFMEIFFRDNEETKCANWDRSSFTIGHLGKMIRYYGYINWRQFKEEYSFYNHKITNIEYLDEKIEVGTLTIDSEEKHNNYHTFALAVGIFTKNSNLGEMGDVEYFQKRLYRALHVPNTRLTAGSTINTGRATEIDREEVKFTKFIKRLRNRFAVLFTDLLRKQLILKNIVTVDEWDAYIKNNIFYDFRKDSHFLEYNEAEIQSRRMELASTAIGLGDDYFSPDYIKKNFLKLSEEEIAEMKKDKEAIEEPEEPTDELGDLDLGDETGMGGEIGLPGQLPGQTPTTSTPTTTGVVAPPTPPSTPTI